MCDRMTISICVVLLLALAGAALAVSPGRLAARNIREKVAECQGPSDPDPADGSAAGRLVFGNTTYIILDYTPCPNAVSHIGYFSRNEQEVIDRDPARCLGSPSSPEISETAFVVRSDDGCYPQHICPPLALTTYYWCVDTFDGEKTIPGPVWSFRLIDEKAWDPNPENGQENVFTEGTMTWNLGDVDTTGLGLSYDIYLGQDEAAVSAVPAGETSSPLFLTNVTTESYDYQYLGMDTEYFWRVDTKLTLLRPPFTSTYYKGNVWRFKTWWWDWPEITGWWRLDGDIAPELAFDSSGYGNHGTLMGDPTFVPGMIDNALALDGVDDWVEIGDVGIDGNEPRTIAAWVKASNIVPDWTNVFGFTGPGGEGSHFDIQLGGVVGPSGFSYRVNFNGESYRIMPFDLEWHHFAVTFDGTKVRLYVDGYSDCFGMPAVIPEFVPDVTIDTTDNVHIGKRHDNDIHFPGLIDDVRIYDRPLSGKEIRILSGNLSARCPHPSDNGTNVELKPTLRWTPGVFAAARDGSIVYYSEDPDAVTNRTAPSATLSYSSFELPLKLDLEQTFYWAVDTVNGIETWPGDLWSFTAINWRSVDDMETYTPWIVCCPIWYVWEDGYGDCDTTGNNTGAMLNENMEIVHTDLQSMQYDYDNDGNTYNPCTMEQAPCPHFYSKTEAQTSKLPSGIRSDWTVDGVRALSLRFYGEPDNDINEPLWVQLQDSSKTYGAKVFYGDYPGEDINDINEPEWHEWLIDMADFAIDLNDVVSIAIGIGNEDANTPGGSGTLYFDEIRLYTPRCIPNRRTPEFANLDQAPEPNPDCKIDCKDLKTMAQNWLKPPNTPNLKDYAELAQNWLKKETWPF